MKKPEIRKLLADFQKARDKVVAWPDGPSSEPDTMVTKPSVNLASTLSAEGSPFVASLTRFQKVCLRTAFLPAEDQFETVLDIAKKQFAGKLPLRIAVEILLGLQPQFTGIRYRLSRAVQPIGRTLDPLAATIGAIRLHDKTCSETASQHLSTTIIKAFQKNDKATLARIKKLSTIEPRSHRNYQIWIAIEEIVREQARITMNAGSSIGVTDGDPAVMKGSISPMPTTSEIRRYVAKRANNPSFSDLPKPKDHKGWTRLWIDSGASSVITKGVRGRKA